MPKMAARHFWVSLLSNLYIICIWMRDFLRKTFHDYVVWKYAADAKIFTLYIYISKMFSCNSVWHPFNSYKNKNVTWPRPIFYSETSPSFMT
jgi:hypothetical protein